MVKAFAIPWAKIVTALRNDFKKHVFNPCSWLYMYTFPRTYSTIIANCLCCKHSAIPQKVHRQLAYMADFY